MTYKNRADNGSRRLRMTDVEPGNSNFEVHKPTIDDPTIDSFGKIYATRNFATNYPNSLLPIRCPWANTDHNCYIGSHAH